MALARHVPGRTGGRTAPVRQKPEGAIVRSEPEHAGVKDGAVHVTRHVATRGRRLSSRGLVPVGGHVEAVCGGSEDGAGSHEGLELRRWVGEPNDVRVGDEHVPPRREHLPKLVF